MISFLPSYASILSAGLIISGLYIVLWGKKKEAKKPVELDHMSVRGPMDLVIARGGSTHSLAQEEEEEIDIEQQLAFAYEETPHGPHGQKL